MQRQSKLWLTAVALLLLAGCLLAGCAGDTGNSDDMVARSDYEAVCAERDQLAAELAQATGDTVRAQLGGSFQATVRGVIPDYVLDDSTPLIAILTTFQSGPFLALVGEKAAQLEVGESYIFQIAATEIGEISAAELENGIQAEEAFGLYDLQIESCQPAGDDDISGPESALLTYQQLP